jgi:four helix bundle protein
MENLYTSVKDNLIREKAFSFSVRIIRLTKYMKSQGVENVLRTQILKCGTSIAANIEEGIAGISRADFSAKLSISYKEARETLFWLKLFYQTDILREKEYNSLFSDCDEISRILYSIIRTSRKKPSN